MNSMKNLKVAKLTLNIGVGAPGDRMEKAKKLLKMITEAKPIERSSIKRIPTWGVRPGLALATCVTVRGKKAEKLLARLLKAVDNKLPSRKFDVYGNFSFGIPEYIDIEGVPYDPSIGVIGLEAAVTLEKPGFRIKHRAMKKKKIPTRHKITKKEAIEFIKRAYSAEVEEEE